MIHNFFECCKNARKYFTAKRITKLTCNQVGVVLDGHFQKSSSKTVLWKDEKYVFEDRPNLLQLVVVEVLQDEDDNGRYDPDEQVDASLNKIHSF